MKTLYFALALSVLALAGCGATTRPSSMVQFHTGPAPGSGPGTSCGSGAPPVANPPTSSGPSLPAPSQPPSSVPANAVKLANIQASSGWESWGQLAPAYQDCSAPCTGVNWTMTKGVSSPSISGNATEFTIGGTIPYSDVLWANPVIGQFSTQGLPDNNHTLMPTIHNFIYDADFYVTDATVTQVLEFDISMYMNSVSMIWGNQCNHLGDGQWDIWDNQNAHWVGTGAACTLHNGWNHVTIQAQRESDNALLFQSFTLNGAMTTLNRTYAPAVAPPSWYGITVNYQMDGDAHQSANTTYVDNLSLTYW